MIITADHGNAEWMFNEATQAPQTAHTTNVVPLVIAGCGDIKLETGRLAAWIRVVLPSFKSAVKADLLFIRRRSPGGSMTILRQSSG